jgi:hypothetical protein
MLTQFRAGNGKPKTSPDQGEMLPFLEPDLNSFRRVSINAAWTDRKTTGHQDTGRVLASELLHDLEQRAPTENPDLDALELPRLRTVLQQQLERVSEIGEARSANLAKQAQLLRDLAVRRPVRVTRQLQEIVSETIESAMTPLRQSLQAQLEQSPFTCLTVIDRTELTLREIGLPPPDYSAQRRFYAGMQAIELLSQVSKLPEGLRNLIAESLHKRCKHEWDAALQTVIDVQLAEGLRQAIQELSPVFRELRGSQAQTKR